MLSPKATYFQRCSRYELEFFVNVVHGNGIVSWAAVDTNRPNEQCDELIGFITARVVAADDSEVRTCFPFICP